MRRGWIPAALLAWTHAGYPVALAAIRRAGRTEAHTRGQTPVMQVAVIVAAHDEESVIAGKVANALALDWPRERLQVVVACDGCTDATAQRAREAGADLVLELPRGGKIRAQDAAVRATEAPIVAFSDANSSWEPDALRALAGAFEDPAVGYACGRVSFVNDGGDNQEGLYWRYEMWVRANESALASVTAGNGAIYAVRREAYVEVDPVMGHDLKLPFTLVRDGWRAVDVATARATEKMVPTIEGEFARKRRMMSHAWPIVVRGGLLDPRGLPPAYLAMLVSHRHLRYASPFLHALAFARGGGALRAAHLALLAAASRQRVARYYVLTTASIAFGLADWLRHGTEAGWDAAEGTR